MLFQNNIEHISYHFREIDSHSNMFQAQPYKFWQELEHCMVRRVVSKSRFHTRLAVNSDEGFLKKEARSHGQAKRGPGVLFILYNLVKGTF